MSKKKTGVFENCTLVPLTIEDLEYLTESLDFISEICPQESKTKEWSYLYEILCDKLWELG